MQYECFAGLVGYFFEDIGFALLGVLYIIRQFFCAHGMNAQEILKISTQM